MAMMFRIERTEKTFLPYLARPVDIMCCHKTVLSVWLDWGEQNETIGNLLILPSCSKCTVGTEIRQGPATPVSQYSGRKLKEPYKFLSMFV
jgi:hypothetical protein